MEERKRVGPKTRARARALESPVEHLLRRFVNLSECEGGLV